MNSTMRMQREEQNVRSRRDEKRYLLGTFDGKGEWIAFRVLSSHPARMFEVHDGLVLMCRDKIDSFRDGK